MKCRISVTGMGILCAAGQGVSAVMDTLYSGARLAAPPKRISCELDVVYPVYEVQNLSAAAYSEGSGIIDNACSSEDSLSVRMLMQVVQEALVQAQLTPKDLVNKRVGVCIGTTTGASLNFADDYFAHKKHGWKSMSQVSSWLHSNPALAVSKYLGLSGPCQTVVNACSSGTDAIGLGMSWLENDVCDIVLAGGVDELSLVSYNGFIRLGVYDPEPCRPFDAGRKGLNLGEGAAMLVLEKRKDAEARGIALQAECAGYGTSADAYHLTAPAPEGDGVKRAIESALEQAEITCDDVDFINVHGTATPDNDRVESRVLTDMFPDTLVSATKGFTGHTLGAAGAIEAVFVIQALLDQKLPASVGFGESEDGFTMCPVSRDISIVARYGLSESLAFGGNNSVLIFSKEL
ncbi:beta-ketoacyl-[acyl-carrier-protein] synthase family protein [Halodesulfovibrio sp.]|uniref:beta-ketoacyl-[acyl-carrier-protein] synthase family protein n=1 Tax=Halodesulfovibrio sp. TaxID=1912772 RepID=UPI0025C6C152|nr:beta-ketoacyl-[acyl-carrier-protein] synthase family protein [Halodesulfovibrio sp.]